MSDKIAFQPDDADQHMENLTTEQRQKWATLANRDYERRMRIGGVTEPQAKTFAARYACQQLLGGRPYER
jgi:hypothetical protein